MRLRQSDARLVGTDPRLARYGPIVTNYGYPDLGPQFGTRANRWRLPLARQRIMSFRNAP